MSTTKSETPEAPPACPLTEDEILFGPIDTVHNYLRAFGIDPVALGERGAAYVAALRRGYLPSTGEMLIDCMRRLQDWHAADDGSDAECIADLRSLLNIASAQPVELPALPEHWDPIEEQGDGTRYMNGPSLDELWHHGSDDTLRVSSEGGEATVPAAAVRHLLGLAAPVADVRAASEAKRKALREAVTALQAKLRDDGDYLADHHDMIEDMLAADEAP